MTPAEFRPTFRSSAVEALVVAALILAAVTAGLYFLKDVPLTLGLGFGALTAALAFAYYTTRFLRRAPRLVRVDQDGLTVVARDGEEQRLRWAEVTRAFHESKVGLQWRFVRSGGETTLRDDGLSVGRWDELTQAITARLKVAGVTVQTDDFAKAFVEDDDEEVDKEADGSGEGARATG